MKMRNATCSLVAIIALLATAGASGSTSGSASNDPFIGKWIFDAQHSTYPAGTRPTRMVIEMESVTRGVRYRSDTTYKTGHTAHAEYTADYNERQVLVWGTTGLMLPVSLKRIDSHTVIASYFKSLHVVATSRRVVSRDGQRMTITTTSKDSSGKNITTVSLYEKQREKPLASLDRRP